MLKARSLESLAKGWKLNLLRLSMLMHGQPLGSCLGPASSGMALMLKARSLESLAKGRKLNLLRLPMFMHGLPWIPVWALMVKAWP